MDNTFEYIEQNAIFHGSALPLMGTKLDMITVGADRQTAEGVWKNICARGEELDKMLSRNNPEGEVGRFNSGRMLAHSAVSEELCKVLATAMVYRISTFGLYDVALGKMGLVDLGQEQRTLSIYGATLDFGGFRKGWLLDVCRKELADAGVKTAFVDLGNSAILCLGKHPFGDAWTVDLANPYSRTSIVQIPVEDRAISISANGPGFTGRIINPKTGEPCESRRIVAVTSPDPVEAKVLSTALMLANDTEAEILQSRFPDAAFHRYEL